MQVTTVNKNPETRHCCPRLVRHTLRVMLMTYLLQLSEFGHQFNKVPGV